MKKNILVLFAVIFLFCSFPGISLSEEEAFISIASREDFSQIVQNPSGSFVLTGDIDMSGEPWTPISFSGILDGAGYKLFNLSITKPGANTVTAYDSEYSEYEAFAAGLFSDVRNAEIRDLHILNADLEISAEDSCFCGAIAGYAENSIFDGCSVQTRGWVTASSQNTGLGGITGFSLDSKYYGCEATAELVFQDTNDAEAIHSKQYLGGIYAFGCGLIEDCKVYTRGYASVYGLSYLGGVVGMHRPFDRTMFSSLIQRTSSDFEVSFYEVPDSGHAYSAAIIGRDPDVMCRTLSNRTKNYRVYKSTGSSLPGPETCAEPDYEVIETAPTCTEWGYTTHTCRGCGYSYISEYKLPQHTFEVIRLSSPTCTAGGRSSSVCLVCGSWHSELLPPTGHTPGDWVTVVAPQVEKNGLEHQLCSVCGEVLSTRVAAALPRVYAERIELSDSSINLAYGQNGHITAVIYPSNVTDTSVVWASSDRSVAKVLPDGTIQTGSTGAAVLSCTSGDGKALASCTVTVSYTPQQFIRHYILFGWLWDK